MQSPNKSILLIGESDVGKSHYGGQLLKRLMKADGRIRMDGAASNLEPFEAVMARLDTGMSADHTAVTTYEESVWPIIDDEDRKAHLIWPEYGGEQVKDLIDTKRIPVAWRTRVVQSPAWLLLIRLQQVRTGDDIFSRPLADLTENRAENQEAQLSDQARLIELLQMLVHVRSAHDGHTGRLPRLLVLLTCWDEMEIEPEEYPVDVLRRYLPMLCDFMGSNWQDSLVFGLSALGRRLDKDERDMDYVTRGSEQFGYVVLEDGTRSPDLTLPIRKLLADFS